MQFDNPDRTVNSSIGSSSRFAPNPNNLPVPGTSFIGRGREILELRRLVLSSRLITLTGPGGCGKTRLAIAVATSLLKSPAFAGGIRFVDFSPLDNPVLVPRAVMSALGVTSAAARPFTQALTELIAENHILLVFDNCEHVLPAAAELAQTLLESCSNLHILATSREPLNLPNASVWLVPSLALPESSPAPQLRELVHSEAIHLFAARAGAALPSFRLDDSNISTVAHICRRLDGIPLALELAAARVRVLDVTQIAERLDDSLQLLARGKSVPRHQTMRAAIDWSYDLLSPSERVLFQRLGVFAGGFTLEAAEAVCGEVDADASAAVPRSAVLDLLSNLADKSLVQLTQRAAPHPVRYRLLEPIRQYALEQLARDNQEKRIRDRHLTYMVRLAEQAEPMLKRQEQMVWLSRLDAEHDNLRAALTWSMREDRDILSALRLAYALHLFWQRRGHWSEARRWLEQAISAYRARRDSYSPSDDIYWARALAASGWLAVYSQDYGETRAALEPALQRARELNDTAVVALLAGLLAFLNIYILEFETAAEMAALAVESARQSGDDWSLAWTLHVYGRSCYTLGDAEKGHNSNKASERLYRKTGDKRSLAVVVNTLAIIEQNAGDIQSAQQRFQEVADLGRELNDQDLEFKGIFNLAGIALIQGDLPQSSEYLEQILERARKVGSKGIMMSSLARLAHIRLARGDAETAHRLVRESVPLAQELGMRMGLVMSISGLAATTAVLGNPALAARAMGATHHVMVKRNRPLDVDDQVQYDQNLALVRASLPPNEFEACYAEGQTLELAQAVNELMSFDSANRRITSAPVARASLHLCALGPTRVLVGERTITTWQYARVKELLFYLASHPSRTKAEIGLALWPDISPAQLRNRLSTTLYHLRRTLGRPDWIVFDEDEYRFNRSLEYQFDVEQFEEGLGNAARVKRHSPEQAIQILQSALALYRGEFVQDLLEGEWFLLRREELRRKYLDGLLDLGHLLYEQGEYAVAAQTFHRAIDADPVVESAHRALMRCYERLGERGQALRHYQTLERIMLQELGSPPAPESVALYQELVRAL
jgi:non-specific serine/threonine protein kinase